MRLPLIHPNSLFKIVWDFYLFAVAILITILAPLMVIFRLTNTAFFLTFDIIVTLSYTSDIIINFNTSYFVRRHEVTDRKSIARGYLKKWFFSDLLSTIPFTWITLLARFSSLDTVLRFFRLLRIIKLFLGAQALKRVHRTSRLNPAFLRLGLLVFWLLIVAHLIACGWIFLSSGDDFSNKGRSYLNAFYWTVTTLTTIGYGDITPVGSTQIIYTIFVMLTGAAIYGFIIGNIANIVAKIDIGKGQFREKIDNVDAFLKYRNIPLDLQKRIHDYNDYLWETHRGYEESQLLDDLPLSLKTQVSLFLNRDIIKKVPIFEQASKELIRDTILNLKPAIYTPGDAIISHGELGDEMYFIGRGDVEVISVDEKLVYATLGAGQFFGEMALILRIPRTATVRAKSYCDLYILNKETFDNILKKYPSFAKKVEERAEIRRKERGMEIE